MLDELRHRINAYLSRNKVCIVSTGGTTGAWTAPGWYCNRGLDVECLLPRWADVVYHLEQNPQVLLVILDSPPAASRWLQYRGAAQLLPAPDWSRPALAGMALAPLDERYTAIRIAPERIDLIDESLGWGARETLDCSKRRTMP